MLTAVAICTTTALEHEVVVETSFKLSGSINKEAEGVVEGNACQAEPKTADMTGRPAVNDRRTSCAGPGQRSGQSAVWTRASSSGRSSTRQDSKGRPIVENTNSVLHWEVGGSFCNCGSVALVMRKGRKAVARALVLRETC